METINKSLEERLQSLEERLLAENRSHENLITNVNTMVAPGTATATAGFSNPIGNANTTTIGSSNNGVGSAGIGSMTSGTFRQPPRSLQTTPNRPRPMDLPAIQRQPEAIETDLRLKKIMTQNGILTIDGIPYRTEINDLEHLGDLGNGTSGNVVKMRHKPSGKIIAVKQMRRTGNTEENKRILMDLDVVLKSHGCDYIVQCLGCFVRDADVWICMELMSMCFDKLLKLSKKPVPEQILGKVTVATAKALAYLKEKHDVIHRDVKPSNILIDEQGNIKLCDFGISGRLVDSKANTRSAGCAAYMAPERIDPKKPKYDVRADVWSLGITLVELATTRSPYHGCLTDFEVLTKVLECDPPSLPRGDGFNFSEEFHDFVRKCLTKDHNDRPKYPELLEQPFIKIYEKFPVDVAQWFKNTVETAGIKTHSRVTPTSTDILTKNYIINGLTNNVAATNSSNSNSSRATSHIPSYQQTKHTSVKKDEQQQTKQQYQQLQTQLPQPTGHNFAQQQQQQQLQIVDRGGGGGGGGSASRNASANSSPLSPSGLSYQAAKDQSTITSEMHNLYRKSSPFFNRKCSNGTPKYKYTDESPKKESMFSAFGQTILRNLTTSPFSQKKHNTNQQTTTNTTLPTQNIDPLWRMPTNLRATSPTTAAKSTTSCSPVKPTNLSNDNCDAVLPPAQPIKSPPLQNIANSPAMARKRFQNYDAKFMKDCKPQQQSPQDEHQHAAPSLIPINKQEAQHSPQRTPGSHSPIVLQRFYHQQNQLREKERERQKQLQQQQQQQYQHQQHHHSPEVITTNPFLSTYIPPAGSTTTSPSHHYHQQLLYNHSPQHYYHQQQQFVPNASHIPLSSVHTGENALSSASSAISSSYSTSSQSSTQSSNSQIGHHGVYNTSDAMSINNQHMRDTKSPTSALSGSPFGGIGSVQLQYQPLPQQYVPIAMQHSLRKSRSPPMSPERTETLIPNAGHAGIALNTDSSGHSKLNKLYGRRQLQPTNAASSSQQYAGNSLGREFRTNAEHGWLNNLTGAMKRQFASYVKTQLNSTANGGNTTAAPTSATATPHQLDDKPKTLNYYHRSVSASSSSNNTSSSTSPTDSVPNNRNNLGNDFHDGGTSSFLRRYAVTGGGCGTSSANPHLLANLDRRNRSPDPPPRYNRGQSPLLLRKNLLELSGQQQAGSPLLNRRYVSASPPLPPPRRGSESVPGSPQHFRTRIHYTPEPQRRIYRTIDQ